jgi:non-heme Fe2+,alpha-ketoglutarate-dependent halogenase
MGKLLSDEQIAAWKSDGCIFPVRAVDADAAEANYRRFLALEDEIGEEPQKRYKIKAHLPFPWMWDIIRTPRILDAVEDIIGPNILCWGSSFFSKQAHDTRFVSWHQDSTYYGLSEQSTVNVWYAFSASDVESGCMRFIPGTHRMGQLNHEETYAADNLLVKGQTINGVDESRAVDVVLQPGEFSIHHEAVIHGSGPNNADRPRIGLSIHYIAPHVHQVKLREASATLVRGRDTHGHWTPEPEPERDFDPVCLAALDRTYSEYRSGAGKH